MKDQFDQLKREVASDMDLDAIWNETYRAVLMDEIANEVRADARKAAEADIRRRGAPKKASR